MKFKLEDIEYQRIAINSVVRVFEGQEKNVYENATKKGIRLNYFNIPKKKVQENLKSIIKDNGVLEEVAQLSDRNDFCIEMETGTGKTLVYLKTIFELYKQYGFTKFIILVPSIAIKEGVIKTFEIFADQLEEHYGFKPTCFAYDSKKLSKVKEFVENQHPQIMIITLQSFNTEDRILNQAEREDLFGNISYIKAIAKTHPIIIMDEPQEGMDTEISINAIRKLNPSVKIRYSATHRVITNLLYRLTPYESYKKGLVKKIKVNAVTEINDEASLKIEFIQGIPPKKTTPHIQAELKVYKFKNSHADFVSIKCKERDNLYELTNNPSYIGYVIERIYKPMGENKFRIAFSNGSVIEEKKQSKNTEGIFREQLYYLIKEHFSKKTKLQPKGIKCLSLIFIDHVANYVENGIIKVLFKEQYKKVFKELFGLEPTDEQIESSQGSYFAQTGKGEYTDREDSMRKNSEIFELIMRNKEALLSFEEPMEFIFSHSALGVGWDNPNVFNIAILNESYNEIKKRQEIGRGLRICVNQNGERIHDKENQKRDEEINLLTVIPNETYTTFYNQYQKEIEEICGVGKQVPPVEHEEKGKKVDRKVIKRTDLFNSNSFKEFWKKLSKKTDFLVAFDEEKVIEKAKEAIKNINVPQSKIQTVSAFIEDLEEEADYIGDEIVETKLHFAPLDLIEEISENTQLSYNAAENIISSYEKLGEVLKNPHIWKEEVIRRIRNIELEEMVRAIDYHIVEENYSESEFHDTYMPETKDIIPTPNRGIYDHIVFESNFERQFALFTDNDPEVVCFLKLPDFYKIKTPIGDYNPDFGIVVKRTRLKDDGEEEYQFVIEIKGTNDLDDKKALMEAEIYKIKCAYKHFKALEIETHIKYFAPIRDYETFRNKVSEEKNG